MKARDVLLAIAVAVIWGMGFIVAKAAMSHFSPILLMALRFTLTALCLVWIFRPPWHLFRELFWISLISTAALLVQLEVPFGLLLAWLVLGDRISLRQALGIGIAFGGALLIIGEPKLQGDLVYAFMVIGGAFTWAVGQIMIKKLGDLGGFKLISGVAVFATPQLYIASLLLESDHLRQIETAGIDAWGAVVYHGLIMTALAYAIGKSLQGSTFRDILPRRIADAENRAGRLPRDYRCGDDYDTTFSSAVAQTGVIPC